MGGRARSGFWVFGPPAGAAGQAIFLRWLSVVGALELSVCEGFDGPWGEVGRFRHGFWSALGFGSARALYGARVTTRFAPVRLKRGESTLGFG